MGKTVRIIILVFAIALYFLAFNIVPFLDFSFGGSLTLSGLTGHSTTERAAVGDKVAITSFHDGWFWDTKTYHYPQTKTTKFYFLGLIPLTIVVKNFNFIYIHLIAGALYSFVFLKVIFSDERGYYE